LLSPEKELQDALALIIACTRRAHQDRPKDIVTIAESITFAKEKMGSLGTVARSVGVSEQQLRDFLAVMRLDDITREKVRTRAIDSVDVVKNLAKLPFDKQKTLAECLSRGEINSQDVRVITGFALRFPQKRIERILREYRQSKDTKIYVVRFRIPDGLGARTLSQAFEKIVQERAIHNLLVKGHVGELELTEAGYKSLRTEVRRMGTTLRGFVKSVLQALVERR